MVGRVFEAHGLCKSHAKTALVGQREEVKEENTHGQWVKGPPEVWMRTERTRPRFSLSLSPSPPLPDFRASYVQVSVPELQSGQYFIGVYGLVNTSETARYNLGVEVNSAYSGRVEGGEGWLP